jgi:uncharacterized SAM-binding protein YcdF (DUF218 family)
MGIDAANVVVVDKPLDTAQEAREVARLFGNSQFVLVTSAYHMPRAVRLMIRAGAHPIPAPTGQRTGGPLASWSSFVPSGDSVAATERGVA